jgi:hypothetical protein
LRVQIDFWVDDASLTLPLFIEVPVPIEESERSYIGAFLLSILPLSTIFQLNFGTVVGVAILLSIVIAGIYYFINSISTYSKIMRNHSYWCMK